MDLEEGMFKNMSAICLLTKLALSSENPKRPGPPNVPPCPNICAIFFVNQSLLLLLLLLLLQNKNKVADFRKENYLFLSLVVEKIWSQENASAQGGLGKGIFQTL